MKRTFAALTLIGSVLFAFASQAQADEVVVVKHHYRHHRHYSHPVVHREVIRHDDRVVVGVR